MALLAAPDKRSSFGRPKIYDYLLVGAGSAGCVLARRLSEEGASVLLLEAGVDTPPWNVPTDIADLYPRSYFNSSYMWPLTVDQSAGGTGRKSSFTQARVMGGGSSLMGMIALRGLPDDYDSWQLPGWGWKDVIPYFRRLEADRDFKGQNHGSNGPVCIRRHMPEDWPPFCRAVGEAVTRLGWPAVADMNDETTDGYGPLPISATLSARASAASAYLGPFVRSRENLTIFCNTTVDHLEFHGTRCMGAWAWGESGRILYRARHTVVCAGALHSPAVLLRSGVGPEQHLSSLGIPVCMNLPGVGQNLQNHPIVYLATHLERDARQPPWLRPGFISALRFSSDLEGGSPADLQMLVLNKSSWQGVGSAVAALGICLMRPSSRGTVRLLSTDASVEPDVRFQLLAQSSDLDRLVVGFRVACQIMSDSQICSLRHEVFTASYSGVVRRLNQPRLVYRAASHALGTLLDRPGALRRSLIKFGLGSEDASLARLGDSEWWTATVKARSFGTYHPVGTCRMGSETDPEAVTRPDGSVLGLDGLSVVDASVIPLIPRANTNLPVLMLAERCADLALRRDRYH